MKKIAFYLPQFHTIPENDIWWGIGFTEWVNVKKAKPQFKGHEQPEVPLNQDYYCLMDSETQEKQSELALKYGVDGFCYYHYWFEGKLLLEKPMEAMLENSQIRIPFCICWANESWSRNWDGLEKDVLIQQNYDEDIKAWKEHFDYLLRFFQDSRYIQDKGRPMILLYKPHLINNCAEMIAYWRQLAREVGFKDLYVGYQSPSCFDYDMDKLGLDFGVEFEPFFTVREFVNTHGTIWKKIIYSLNNPSWLINRLEHKIGKAPYIYDYDKIWNRILKRKPINNNIYPGAFPSWDNTPRRGMNATVFWKSTPDKFKEYFGQQMKHAKSVYNADYIFINAWNEWAEGAHLEPDEKNQYGYLEAIKTVDQREN